MFGRERTEGAVELVVELHPGHGIARVGRGLGERDDARPCSSLAARLGERGAHHQPVRPGIEAVEVAQAGEVPPDGHQRLLDRVVGAIAVADDAVGDRVQAVGGIGSQERVGIPVTVLCSLDHESVHSPVPRWHTLLVRFTLTGARCRWIFQSIPGTRQSQSRR